MFAGLDYRPVLELYPSDCRPREVEFLAAAGGFSGAQFWRLETGRGRLCLRRWPREHPPPGQLEFIQSVLWHVHQEGFALVPLPLETRTHAGYVRHAGYLWQLEPWLPGRADFHQAPSVPRLEAAMTTLAHFHRAAASFPISEAQPAPSPGIGQRLTRLRDLQAGGLADLAARIDTRAGVAVAARARRLLELFPFAAPSVDRLLAQALDIEVRIQPCIRDIWHDHVFFEGDRVTGFIDFGAMRPETVAGDVARLLGSLVADDVQLWQRGLAAYEAARPLTPAEARLVSAFDRANVLLGGISWLSWCFQQAREFENRAGMLARMDHYLGRLTHLAAARSSP